MHFWLKSFHFAHTLEELAHRVMTPVERPLHHKLVAEAGLTMDHVRQADRSPTNTAYVNHMLTTASLYGLGPTAAALLPCPWSYHELKDSLGQSEHPLYGQWTYFYVAGLLQGSVDAWRGFVDQAARQGIAIEDLQVVPATLEDVFLELTGHGILD